MSKITNGGLTRSGIGCFNNSCIHNPHGNSGRQRVKHFCVVAVEHLYVYHAVWSGWVGDGWFAMLMIIKCSTPSRELHSASASAAE